VWFRFRKCGLANGETRKSWFVGWYNFIGGEWLEEWTADQVRSLAGELGLNPERDVAVGFHGVSGFQGKNSLKLMSP
jgi:hypothetical protein